MKRFKSLIKSPRRFSVFVQDENYRVQGEEKTSREATNKMTYLLCQSYLFGDKQDSHLRHEEQPEEEKTRDRLRDGLMDLYRKRLGKGTDVDFDKHGDRQKDYELKTILTLDEVKKLLPLFTSPKAVKYTEVSTICNKLMVYEGYIANVIKHCITVNRRDTNPYLLDVIVVDRANDNITVTHKVSPSDDLEPWKNDKKVDDSEYHTLYETTYLKYTEERAAEKNRKANKKFYVSTESFIPENHLDDTTVMKDGYMTFLVKEKISKKSTTNQIISISLYKFYEKSQLYGRHVYLDVWCTRGAGGKKSEPFRGSGRITMCKVLFDSYRRGYEKIVLSVVYPDDSTEKSSKKIMESTHNTYFSLGFKAFEVAVDIENLVTTEFHNMGKNVYYRDILDTELLLCKDFDMKNFLYNVN